MLYFLMIQICILEYQLPYIIYSTIISNLILRLMLQLLVLTDKDVLKVKLQKNRIMAIQEKNRIRILLEQTIIWQGGSALIKLI